MLARVNIDKTFDDGKAFKKEYAGGDFLTFFTEEGEYLDRLCGIMTDKAAPGESFTVTYTVTVSK